jgi:hypothetical protein
MQNPTQRKCSVCKIEGHTVSTCTNALAGEEVAIMMCQPTVELAVNMCRRMYLKYVPFALCHGFGVPASGGRVKLIQCVLQKFGVVSYVPPVHVPVYHAPVHVAHKEMMKTLKTVVTCRNERSKKTDTPVACGICFEDFKPSAVAKTGCGHDFCATCISGWAGQRGIRSFIRCPCCRTEIDELSVGNKTELKKITSGLAPKPI